MDIEQALQSLATDHRLFHSEADLQHCLAWKIHEQDDVSRVILEKPFPPLQAHCPVCDADDDLSAGNKRIGRPHMDIWAQGSQGTQQSVTAVEVKYKTKGAQWQSTDDSYDFSNHSAQDCGRYDFLKDIERLEYYVSMVAQATPESNVVGFALFLTNDQQYWNRGRSGTNDAMFRLSEGISVAGHLTWAEKTGDGTKKDRERCIRIRGNYKLEWRHYLTIPTEKESVAFKYLLLKVSPQPL